MTLLSYRMHLSIAIVFFLALLFSVANDILGLGFFGRAARVVSAVTTLAFIVYGAFFMPTRQEVGEYLGAKRSKKQHDAQ